MENKIKNIKIACSIMLLIALFNNPYSYYQILKWVITIASGYLANHYFKASLGGLGWVFVAIAVLYNPIAPIFFERGTWEVINVLTIGMLIYTYRK